LIDATRCSPAVPRQADRICGMNIEKNANERKGSKGKERKDKERDRGEDKSLSEAPWQLETVIETVINVSRRRVIRGKKLGRLQEDGL